MNVFNTKGIVLRTVKYGETSLIVTIFTESFGIQSYIINGVRSSSSKGAGKANLFQPAALLDLMVYHNELKNLQRIKEFKWAFLYQNIFFDVVKNSIALFMIELLHKSLKQPEANADLFHFVEDAFIHLDQATPGVVANFPLYFSLHLMNLYGFRFTDTYSENKTVLDLQEGLFQQEPPSHPYFLDGEKSFITSLFLRTMQPQELEQIRLNKETRRELLLAYQTYFALHISEFGVLKTLPVLKEVLE
jgi:DNA repair protein RecO (recombination protein O)